MGLHRIRPRISVCTWEGSRRPFRPHGPRCATAKQCSAAIFYFARALFCFRWAPGNTMIKARSRSGERVIWRAYTPSLNCRMALHSWDADNSDLGHAPAIHKSATRHDGRASIAARYFHHKHTLSSSIAIRTFGVAIISSAIDFSPIQCALRRPCSSVSSYRSRPMNVHISRTATNAKTCRSIAKISDATNEAPQASYLSVASVN
jgi:hypothetical protein